MDHLRCVVERITYQNAQNGYSVIKCRVKGYSDLVTVVGSMPDVHVGSVLELGGSWRVDPKYGRQFSMETFEETLPATVFGIEKYLGSGLIKGIGPKYAKKIVQEFGKDTLEVIETDPDRLNTIPGIGKMRVEKIKQSWQEQKEIKNIMLFLQGHDVSTSHATKIYRQYGNDSIEVVKENPYRLADDIWGIGFRTADTIAEKMGFGHERYARLRSGILYTLNPLSDDGHCFATREMLLESGAELLSVEDNVLSMTLDEMIRQKDVITEDIPKEKLSGEDGATPSEGSEDNEEKQERAIYLPPFFFSEMGVVRRMSAILKNREGIHVNAQGLSERISRKTRMHYDQIQMQAIIDAVTSKILLLVGTKKALAYAVRNVTVTKRNTMLKERLQKALEAYSGEGVFETEPKLEEGPVSDQEVQALGNAREGDDQSAENDRQDNRISYDDWLKTDLFERLSRSDFRSRFRLRDAEKAYIQEKGMETIRSHAVDFVRMRLAPAMIPNDGKQTPMKGHPVFIGQHATATCCRGCLSKWHGIPAGRELTEDEQAYVVDVLMEWIRRQEEG